MNSPLFMIVMVGLGVSVACALFITAVYYGLRLGIRRASTTTRK